MATAGETETVAVRQLMGTVEEHPPDITKRSKPEAQLPVVDARGMDFPPWVLPQIDIPSPSGVWVRDAVFGKRPFRGKERDVTFRTKGGIDP